MHVFFLPLSHQVFRFAIFAILLLGALSPVVMAADASMDAEFGDVINLHGVSYTSDQVYLFLTGPGLPADGVMLTDVSQQADQGHFTIVDVGSDQTWSMKWYTHRIENEIDPGTYVVYVTNEPVDKSHLGGPSSYKTLEVTFSKSSTSRVSASGGDTYVLNPEKGSSVSPPALSFTSPTPTPTSPPPTSVPAPIPMTSPPPLPTTKAASCPVVVLIALFGLALNGILQKKK